MIKSTTNPKSLQLLFAVHLFKKRRTASWPQNLVPEALYMLPNPKNRKSELEISHFSNGMTRSRQTCLEMRNRKEIGADSTFPPPSMHEIGPSLQLTYHALGPPFQPFVCHLLLSDRHIRPRSNPWEGGFLFPVVLRPRTHSARWTVVASRSDLLFGLGWKPTRPTLRLDLGFVLSLVLGLGGALALQHGDLDTGVDLVQLD